MKKKYVVYIAIPEDLSGVAGSLKMVLFQWYTMDKEGKPFKTVKSALDFMHGRVSEGTNIMVLPVYYV